MKRYIKYGLIIIAALAAVAFIFYIIKKPKESVIKNIPSDVIFCFTIDKRQFLKESDLLDEILKDSLIKKFKSKIPEKALELYKKVGLNSFGDIAIFGDRSNDINVAWIGNNEENLKSIIKKYNWPEKKYKTFNQAKISENLYINYKWPIVMLSTTLNGQSTDFFNPAIKKLTEPELQNSKTDGCLIYGFIITDRNFILDYPFIPLYGRAFAGLKKNDKNIEIYFIQRRIKLRGKLGLPQKAPLSHALLSWPIDSQPINQIKHIPNVVMENLNQLITKPTSHLYAEVLDTISTYQEIVRYNLDAEFKLSQKIINQYKAFPGLRLEFRKKIPDNSFISKPTNLGLDIFKLQYTETNDAYIIASEDKPPRASEQKMPDYYLYANLDMLKTDPFWESYLKTSFKKVQVHAEALGKGSVFVLTLE